MSEIKGKTGSKFTEKVLSLLEELHIWSNGARFQCYDTTSSMSGNYNGAQAKISKFLERLISYIMCMGYKTNLCMEHSSKESRMIDIYMEKVEELQEGIILKNLPVTRCIGHLESGDCADW